MQLEDRIAKAWRVKVDWSDDWDIVHAETASKARAKLKRDLSDPYPDLTFRQISVRRAPDHDRRLPPEHRLVAELSEAERQIILHAFGASRWRDAGYRDHYCTCPGDMRLLRLSWELGLFSGPHGERAYGATSNWSGAFFYLTDLGKHVALSMMPTYP